MKYLIILLTSLFLVSNAYSHYTDEEDDRYIHQLCSSIEYLISANGRKMNDTIDPHKDYKADYNIAFKEIEKYAKIYHYLDCREELVGELK